MSLSRIGVAMLLLSGWRSRGAARKATRNRPPACRTPIPGSIPVPDVFAYRDGVLHAESVPIARIAAAVGTPFYVYSAASLRARYRAFADAFAAERPLVCFAVKANSNLAVLRLLAGLGAGADVVSEGELRRALAAGIPPQRIIFSGVGKTRGELEAALAAGIRQINVESIPELHRLSAIASGAPQDRRRSRSGSTPMSTR